MNSITQITYYFVAMVGAAGVVALLALLLLSARVAGHRQSPTVVPVARCGQAGPAVRSRVATASGASRRASNRRHISPQH